MNIQLRVRSRMSSNSNDRPSTATQRWSGRARAADLSVSAMADADDSVSMVGAAPRQRQAIDQFAWGRAALHFAGISVAEHEGLAQKLGVGAAGEVLLLVIAQQCGTNTRKWQQARDLGIPWQAKRWTSLTGLQRDYNDAVAKALELGSFDEDSALLRAPPPAPSPPPPSPPSPSSLLPPPSPSPSSSYLRLYLCLQLREIT